ncbi:Uu.00g091480.m01.CDS01 [Anthostomella pinea]|uniref:Uu.00g091480.m01.CDS01 n=1 Tax=Anthostomella pinea TaxID=933095 RepID=A0AAI8VNR8_9PEZI|nr:Uu.00g091480.m01.CDS01 [Anthostomella pinea]
MVSGLSGPMRRVLLSSQRGAGVASLFQPSPLLPRANNLSAAFTRAKGTTSNQTTASSLVSRATRSVVPAQHASLRFFPGVARHYAANKVVQKESQIAEAGASKTNVLKLDESGNAVQPEDSLGRSEKGAKAAEYNYSARLSKEGKDDTKGWRALKEVGRLLRFARPELLPLTGAIVLLFTSSAITLGVPYVVGKIMDLATTTTFEDTRIFGLTLYQFFPAFALFLSVGACSNFGRIVLLRIIGERVVTRLRSQLFRRTVNQDAEFFDANKVGDLISRLGSDTVIVGKSITQNVSDGLRALISGIAGLSAMTWISPELSMTILYAVPFIGTATFLYTRVIRRLSRTMQARLGQLTKVGEERLGNVRTSQMFVGEAQEVGRYNKQVRKIFSTGVKMSKFDALFYSWNGWVGQMMIIALLWSGGGLVREGILTTGDLTTFMMYAAWAGSSVGGVTNFLSELMKGVGAATRLFELQDRKPTIPLTRGNKITSAKGAIKFSDVGFVYPTRPSVSVFKRLDFEIPGGSNVCIVGPSGSGKSTVSALMLRFYNPTTGIITLNGEDITKFNVKQLRRKIGVVSQEPVLFSGTIQENIAYGRPGATLAEIKEAARRANCTFIQDQPQGFETAVGSRGAQLSGGQKQRIAIARALITNPDILILDEATSALDAESETAVNAALATVMDGNMTIISIAHRQSTIARSDRVIVLSKQGTVDEVGTYAELYANKESALSKLLEHQRTGAGFPDPRKSQPPDLVEEEVTEEELHEHDEEDADDAVNEKKSRK